MEFVYENLLLPLLGDGAPAWFMVALSALIPAAALVTFMAVGPIVYVYAERKIAGFMQDRLGPMRVGPWGLLQTVADAVKLLFKEAIFPAGADKLLFLIAPCLVVTGAFLSFVVIPFGSRLQTVDLDVGLFYVVAVSSLSTVGLIMAGWASNNKYALFGAMRSAAQIVSYEIPAVISLVTVVMVVGSLSLQEVVWHQQGGLHNWLLFRYFPLMPAVFLIFFTATLAECNRTPFDIPEAESELVAGFHTEYSGFFFAMFFMAEYTEMFIVSAVASVLFLGGWWAPHPALQAIPVGDTLIGLGPVWLVGKAWFLVFIHMWLRWTLPRLRVDQLMYVAWKVLLPTALVLATVIGGLTLVPAVEYGWTTKVPPLLTLPRPEGPVMITVDQIGAWLLALVVAGYLVYVMVAARRWAKRRLQQLAA